MSKLNTSNISVPSVATMVQHLSDENPHPQYLKKNALAEYLKNNIFLGDLADVQLTQGLPSKSLIMFDGLGHWVNIPADELLTELDATYATTVSAGVVRLATFAEATLGADTSAAITPASLTAWATSNGVITNDTFYPKLSAVLADESTPFPVALGRINNVTITNPISVGQVLTLLEYNPDTNRQVWGNQDVFIPKATTLSSGVIKIATTDQVKYGVDSTFEEMEASGHIVPSLASLQTVLGIGNKYVSRVEPNVTSKYDYISGPGESGEGIASTGVSTVINKEGYVIDHTIAGGVLVAQAGNAYGVVMSSGSISAYRGTELTNVRVISGVVLGNGCTYTNFVQTGAGLATFNDAEVHVMSTYASMVYASSAIMEHGTIFSGGIVDINSTAKAFHVYVSSGGRLNVNNGGYAEDVTVCSGGSCCVASGGVVEGLTMRDGAYLSVASGGTVNGLIKYGKGTLIIDDGANVDQTGDALGDLLVTSLNISSSVITFSSTKHPVGLRKVWVPTGSVNPSHAFYPMAAATRIPNATDKSFNDYTINASGLSTQDDINSAIATTKWYVVF